MNTHAPTAELLDAADSLAQRLRLIQAEFIDEEEQVRQQYLVEEIQNTIQEMVPNQRASLLNLLVGHFPTLEDIAASQGAPAAPGPEVVIDDPIALTERFLDDISGFGDKDRMAIADKLQQADWPKATHLVSTAGKSGKSLGLKPDQEVDPLLLIDLAAKLLDALINLEQVSIRVWQEVAPQSTLRMTRQIQKHARSYITGDGQSDQEQFQRFVERIRQFTAALIFAVGQLDSRLHSNVLADLSPERIEEWADRNTSLLTAKGVQCWKRYKHVWSKTGQGSVEKQIRLIIQDYVESVMTYSDEP